MDPCTCRFCGGLFFTTTEHTNRFVCQVCRNPSRRPPILSKSSEVYCRSCGTLIKHPKGKVYQMCRSCKHKFNQLKAAKIYGAAKSLTAICRCCGEAFELPYPVMRRNLCYQCKPDSRFPTTDQVLDYLIKK